MGVVHVGRTMGTAVGGILTGLLFDMYGNYDLAYWIAAVLALLSIVSAWAVIAFETRPQVHKV